MIKAGGKVLPLFLEKLNNKESVALLGLYLYLHSTKTMKI